MDLYQIELIGVDEGIFFRFRILMGHPNNLFCQTVVCGRALINSQSDGYRVGII